MFVAAFTGLIAGITHVLSGPDHLAAIAPLAVRRPKAAWVPGLRWGIGHSSGVAVIGMLSLWLRDLLPVKLISSWGERIVGVMLIGIGCWALRKAFRIHAHEHEHDGGRHFHLHSHSRQAAPHHEPEAHHRHTHAAFGIGILHGLAGSSHFLGVLPSLAFPTRFQALTYLLTFGVGTVVAMASFSGFVGWVTASCAATDGTRIYRRLMGLCAASTVAVGCFWLFW
jgi:ABC-type nickel/cobalt efflux system permease component RcnA